MADTKDIKPRTFVKKTPGAEPLTRTVTGPASEVAALFDGFQEQTGSKASPGGGAVKPTASS